MMNAPGDFLRDFLGPVYWGELCTNQYSGFG